MRRFAILAGLAAVAGIFGAELAQAHPSRIILLRHGEKKNSLELCDVGVLRAQALSDQYLGKGAPGNELIFGKGGAPDAFFAVTAHTQETAGPSAESWGKTVTVFPVPAKDPNEDSDLDAQTRKAAAELTSADYADKTVVVVWEHKHISKKELNKEGNTFWSLLALGDIVNTDAPKSWEGVNYDYFWIIDYGKSSPSFTVVKQQYAEAVDAKVPDNSWGEAPDQNKFPEFYRDCKQ